MVTVSVGVESIDDDGERVARAIEAWAVSNPGEEPMQVVVYAGSYQGNPIAWPGRVCASVEAVRLLATSIGEHAMSYEIKCNPERNARLEGGTVRLDSYPYGLSSKPGLVTPEQLRVFWNRYGPSTVALLVLVAVLVGRR